MSEPQKTPLYNIHKERGGKVIDFGGWYLPVQFSSIIEEVNDTRTNAGLFDVSHMGEIIVEGPNSENFLQKMLTNDVTKLKDGKIQYTLMCYENGGVVDDFVVYRLQENKYLLVVNATNTKKDYDWLKKHQIEGVEVKDYSDEYGQIAIQGPKAEQILQRLTDYPLENIKFFNFANVKLDDFEVLLSRTGYTGEDGFEIYSDASDTKAIWERLEQVGETDGLKPIGLGARDVLRFEVCLPLYGNELSPEITPLEAGLGFFVKLKKDKDFIGKNVLQKQKEQGLPKTLVGFEMLDKGIPRTGYTIEKDGEEIGFVSSGSHSPTLDKVIGLGFINPEYNEIGTELEVKIRNRTARAKIVKTPFYGRG
ncbi:glycine cleavage system aminomethyltransferase GcvT [Natranaerobius trueperi]|uniref:Aminomethyltransferase n=1 Tax=Natranaerobius trueperi TaxID=759412 RepID=A0A226BVK5_9FIRM|nr:glycine cleavage system aminomethyltransferase GcvT [Natranaerobius trueperi]OWZ83023.1 glycine cleavage system protein T [Natranaerobius trueperi]